MGGKIKCPACKKVLHSMYRHDFQSCGCPAETFVDGGFDYNRVGGHRINEIEFIHHNHWEDGIDPKDLGDGC